MTIRPLPDIDLARIAPQSKDMKRKSLEQFRFGRVDITYQPTRNCYADLLNVQPEMFGAAEPTEWAVIEERIKKASKSDMEEAANLRVARGLHDFATAEKVVSRKQEFFPMAMRMGSSVKLWLPMVLGLRDEPHAVFVDPRRSRGLDAEARRFVFSMMHERIRAADDDYAGVRLAIFRFADPDGDRRALQMFTDEGVTLYSLDEMESMVAETYAIWREVCEERDRDARRRPTGTGPLI